MGIRLLWFAAIVSAIGSFLVAYCVKPTPENAWLHMILISLWTLGPPTWFLSDASFRITRPNQEAGAGKLTDQEKFFYDSAAKFWAGVLALLIAIYTRDKWIEQPKGAPSKPVTSNANP
jgi:hypothetical protein